jgi:acetyl/propionyl-CoA carboxylase alpha subunit
MHGKVVRVQVEAGLEIEKGADVVVVEAMKMQNEMKSPRETAYFPYFSSGSCIPFTRISL